MLANQWNKRATTVIFLALSCRCLDYSYQALTITRIADRHNQPPADFELRNQRLRNRWSTGRDEYAIVRSMRGPTKRTVETLNSCVVDFQLANPSLRLARKIADAFDCINLRRDHRQHRSLVPRACANLQHTTILVELKQLRHARNDERLRDRLIRTDRQRVIAIGTTLQCLRHEEVAWYVSDCFEHAWVFDPVMIA